MTKIVYQGRKGEVLSVDEAEALRNLEVISLSPTVLFIEEEEKKLNLKQVLEKKNTERLSRRRGEMTRKSRG